MSGDNYLWAGPVSDSWDAAGNWDDTTTGTNPAAAAPSVNDAVTIDAAAGGAVQTITGTGASASLTLLGATDLSGQFTTGALNIQVSDSINQPLSLGGGDSLAVSGDVTSDGTIQVNGGAFTVGGAVNTFNLGVSNSGSVQIAGSFTGQIQVDASSTAEIGSSHTATAGEIVIDAGATTSLSASATNIINNGAAGPFLSASNSIVNNGALSGYATAATIVNNGTVSGDLASNVAGGGTLTNNGTISDFSQLNFASIVNSGTIAATSLNVANLVGSVTGTGQITIGAGVTLQVSGPIASGNTINFLGGNSSLLISGSLDAPIVGFGANDAIVFSDNNYVTSASSANGTLTLYEGASSVATLQLVGNYTGMTFLANPAVSQNGYPDATQIDVTTGGDTGTPPAGTSTSDNYVWSGPVAGSWDAAGNWDDTTTGMNPAAVAPGVNDAVTINATAGGAAQVITGTGTSASLTILGATDLVGQFTTGALSFEVPFQPLFLGGGDSLAVTGDVTSDGTIQVTGGSFTAGGAVSVGSLAVSNGGSVQIGGSFTGQIQVDSSSTAEIGSSHNATAGEIVVDAGATVSGDLASATGGGTLINNGTISDFSELDFASIVNSGTIDATNLNPANLVGSVTGTGQITIANGATLQVSGQIASGNTITFAGGNGSLLINGSLSAAIVGFDASDAIVFSDNNYVTSASYANGTLTLYEGATSVATLQLVGADAGATFTVTQVASQNNYPDATQIAIYNAPPVLTAPASISALNGMATAVSGLSVTDADAVSAGETLTIVLADQAGLLSANTGAAGGGGVITGSGSTYLTISGDLAQVSADLSTVALLSNTGGPDSIAVSADDGRGGVSNVQIAVSVIATQVPPDAFNGDGTSDILWHNGNGDSAIWYMSSTGGFTPADLGVVDTSWIPEATGDFNLDGRADILWRNTNGEVGWWLSNGGTGATGFTKLDIGHVDTSWVIQGTGDFNGDGTSDILWRNTNGDTAIWYMASTGGYTPVDLGVVDPSWTIQQIGDFNADGYADIWWRNANGEIGMWLATGSPGGAGFVKLDLGNVSTNWVTQGIGDFNGDHTSDLLWRNTSTGDTALWFISSTGGYTPVALGVVDLSWSIAGVGDYNADGKADILWRNKNGDVGEWLSNTGPGFTGFDKIVATNAPTSWNIVGSNPASASHAGAAKMAHAMAAMDVQGASATIASTAQAASGMQPLIAVAEHGL